MPPRTRRPCPRGGTGRGLRSRPAEAGGSMRSAVEKRHESGGTAGRIAPRRRVVLVVDDDRDVREALALALELGGYLTVRAGDGLDALLALRTGPSPDVIVLDLEMPIMSGWDFRA